MDGRVSKSVTFDAVKSIQPFYTGGAAVLDRVGRILATSLGEEVVLTDLSSGDQVESIEGDGEAVTSLAITPSGSHLAVCSRSNSMRIYSLKPGPSADNPIAIELLRTLKPHPTPVICSAIDETGTLLATGGADGTVKVWDIGAGFTTHTFKGHSGLITSLKFFEQHASDSGQVDSAKKANDKRKLNGDYKSSIPSQSRQQSANRLFRIASGGEDGNIRVWDLNLRKRIAALDSHASPVRSLDFSQEKGILISGSRDKTLVVWDAASWKRRKIIPVLEGIESIGFLSNAELVYTGGETARVRIWNITRGEELTAEQPAGNDEQVIVDIINCPLLSCLISVHADNSFVFHSVQTLEDTSGIPPLPTFRRISGTHDEIIDLAYLGRDQSLMALATNSEEVRIISVSEPNDEDNLPYFGADVGLLSGHSGIVICLDIDWSGCWVATGAKDNTLKLWSINADTLSFECYASFTGHAESVGAVALSKASPPLDSAAYVNPLSHPPSYMVSGSQDQTIKRWEISKKSKAPKALFTRKAHDKDINALAIHPTLPIFASASQDRLVKIWSLESGETIGILRGHRRGVWTVAFSPASTAPIPDENNDPSSKARGYLLTGSSDRTLKLWSLTVYTCLRTFEGHSNSILKTLWLPPSPSPSAPQPLLASSSADTLIKIWDASTGDCLTTLDNHSDRIWALGVSKAGALVSGSADAVLTFWANTTATTAAAVAEAQSTRIEADQALQNHIYAHNYRAAIPLALELDHPGRLLAIFENVIFFAPREEGSLIGVKAVDDVLASLSDEQVRILLRRVRDWFANSRHEQVAARLAEGLFKMYPAQRLARMRGVPELMPALRAHSERYYKKMCGWMDESYVLDYLLERMGMPPEVGVVGDAVGLEKMLERDMSLEGDVEMVD
ncbi:MAG: U3 small nucleolar RNA-associated protein 13 [Vezdaea aestivalis]|nr:MAG: U3 small nucleolar RNA-associated protein 13 [Vezdaea aestivalis]